MMRKATKTDVVEIMKIIAATVEEMKSYNNTQWDENYPQAENFSKDIDAGDLYVDELGGEIRGFVCVNYIEPSEYDDIKWQSSEKAMIVHRMAVNPNFRNQGVGLSLLKFSENLALENGVKYLKTDTYSINDKMNSLFRKFGFKLAGEMEFLGKEKPFYCYDKIISEKSEEEIKYYNVPENTEMSFPFSHAVEAGDFIFLSGQPSMELATGKFIDGDFGTQLEQCFSNLDEVLKAAKLSRKDVIKCTVFLIDMRDYPVMNEIYKAKFGKPFPARSCIATAGLPLGAKVEVEMIAYRNK